MYRGATYLGHKGRGGAATGHVAANSATKHEDVSGNQTGPEYPWIAVRCTGYMIRRIETVCRISNTIGQSGLVWATQLAESAQHAAMGDAKL